MTDLIKLWKKLKIDRCECQFDCGGDNMGNTDFTFYDKKGEIASPPELEEYFNNAMYENVDFYVNSDGHYQGESGTVTITLEDGEFSYSKSATSEYSENISTIIEVELTKKEIDFIKKNVSNINGGDGFAINYKRDLILTDEDEKLVEGLENKLTDVAASHEPDLEDTEFPEGEIQEDWYTFTTNSEHDEIKELTIEGNKLKIVVTNSVTDFRSE